MTGEQFAGDRKEGQSLLHDAKERLKAVLVPCVPQGIEAYHLTLTTVVWSILQFAATNQFRISYWASGPPRSALFLFSSTP